MGRDKLRSPCAAKHTACVNLKHESAEEKTSTRREQKRRSVKKKKKENRFSVDEGAGAPHTIPVPLDPSPAGDAWGQRTERVR